SWPPSRRRPCRDLRHESALSPPRPSRLLQTDGARPSQPQRGSAPSRREAQPRHTSQGSFLPGTRESSCVGFLNRSVLHSRCSVLKGTCDFIRRRRVSATAHTISSYRFLGLSRMSL